MQTVNPCNFNTVKEAYLNNCDFMHTGDLDHVSSTRHMGLQGSGFPSLFFILDEGEKVIS